MKLKDRIEEYQAQADYKLLSKLPIIITLNGRSFSKHTSLLDKPYDFKFGEAMEKTLLQLCSNIDGVIFGYSYHDQINLILRNDQNHNTNPWFSNKIQKIASATAAMASTYFAQHSCELNTLGDGLFLSEVFNVPNIGEAINAVIYKQQHNFHVAIQIALFYELLKKYDKSLAKEMIIGLSNDEKLDSLQQECNIDFNDYPIAFRRGVACYKIPKIIDQNIKNKWFINKDLPIFSKDQEFLQNIFNLTHLL
jgi:tRNA(His) 5'-end guanylyltransferase